MDEVSLGYKVSHPLRFLSIDLVRMISRILAGIFFYRFVVVVIDPRCLGLRMKRESGLDALAPVIVEMWIRDESRIATGTRLSVIGK